MTGYGVRYSIRFSFANKLNTSDNNFDSYRQIHQPQIAGNQWNLQTSVM